MGRIITLLTDFGWRDTYVGAVKGVILSRCADCRIVDITHDIPPGDILRAACALLEFYGYYPAGTVHLAVVDPGVGGARRPILVETQGHCFVGPDNGLFAPLLEREKGAAVRHIVREDLFLRPVSPTFHGRDLFAPVAAFLASGGEARSVGPEIHDWVKLEIPRARMEGREIRGIVLHQDRFGNAVTNIEEKDLARLPSREEVEVIVEGRRIRGLRRTYADVNEGEPLALVGSSGALELAVRGGSAVEVLGLEPGRTAVILRWSPTTGKV